MKTKNWLIGLILITFVLQSFMSFAEQKLQSSNLIALQINDKESDTTTGEEIFTDDSAEGEEELVPEEDPLVPTHIQWIILSVVALIVGLVSFKFKAHQLTTEGDLRIYSITKTFSIPLHPAIYKFMFFITVSMVLVGFAICLARFNSVYMPDIVGTSIAGPIFAYLIHLLYLMEKGRKEEN